MTISLDGFVSERRGSASRLYPDLADPRGTDYMNTAIEETGAVLMGRRTFEVPPRQDEHLTFAFVTEGVESAVEQAKTAAGDKVVQVVGGPSGRRCLNGHASEGGKR